MRILHIALAAIFSALFATTSTAAELTDCSRLRVNVSPGTRIVATGFSAGLFEHFSSNCIEINDGISTLGYAEFEFVGLDRIEVAEWDIYFPAYSSDIGEYTAGLRLSSYALLSVEDGFALYIAYGPDNVPMALYVNQSNTDYLPGAVYFQGRSQVFHTASPVPEPNVVWLFGIGASALGMQRVRLKLTHRRFIFRK